MGHSGSISPAETEDAIALGRMPQVAWSGPRAPSGKKTGLRRIVLDLGGKAPPMEAGSASSIAASAAGMASAPVAGKPDPRGEAIFGAWLTLGYGQSTRRGAVAAAASAAGRLDVGPLVKGGPLKELSR